MSNSYMPISILYDYETGITIEALIRLVLEGKEDALCLENNREEELIKGLSARENPKAPAMFRYTRNNVHTCRETTLYALSNLSFFAEKTPLKGNLCAIKYFRDGSMPIPKQKIDKIDIFLKHNKIDEISVEIVDGEEVWLFFGFSYSNLTMASLMLFIFRKEHILDSLLKTVDFEALSRKGTLRAFSFEFLKNTLWGDVSSPAFSLSLYCFMQYLGERTNRFHNGPVSESISVTLQIFYRFLKEVYVPTLGDNVADVLREPYIPMGIKILVEIVTKSLNEKAKKAKGSSITKEDYYEDEEYEDEEEDEEEDE